MSPNNININMNSLPPPPPPPYPPPPSVAYLAHHNQTEYPQKLKPRKLQLPWQKEPEQPPSTTGKREVEGQDEDKDNFAGRSRDFSSAVTYESQYTASENGSTAESLGGCKVFISSDSVSTLSSIGNQFSYGPNADHASRTKNDNIWEKEEDINGAQGKENNSPKTSEKVNCVHKSENCISVKKVKPEPAAAMRGITSSASTWTMKKNQKRKSSNGPKSKASNVDTDKTPIASKNNRKSPTSNFFMQMGDDEVGNHNTSDIHTQVTEQTASNSSISKSTTSGKGDEGLTFQPHCPAGDYLTPIRGTMGKTKTGLTIDKSPQSVMEGVGSSISSKNVTLTSFPRYAGESDKLGGKRSQQYHSGRVNRHDSSIDDSDTVADEGYDDDIDDASVGTSIVKTISDSLPPVLNKFHDFIIGAPCWSHNVSQSDLIGGLSSRCVMSARDHAEQDDDEDEERSSGSPEHSYASNDDEDASFYSSENSSRISSDRGGRNKKTITAKKYKNATLQKKKKNGGVPKREQRTSRKSLSPRRGRSPTIKEGYNSDGESLRSRSRGSRASRRSRGSLSLSADSSTGSDIEVPQFRCRDIGVSVSSPYRMDMLVMDLPEETIEKRDGRRGSSFGVVIGGGGVTSLSSSVNAVLDDTRYDNDPSGVVRHASGSSAVDSSGSCIDSSDGVICPSSIVAAENVLSYDQAMWLSMTHEKPSLTGRVDTKDERNSKSSVPTTIEGYFKKILTVGIQLILNDPPASDNGPRLNRNGKMFLKFGTLSHGTYENPRFHWTDGHSISYTFELLDIDMIRQPTESELDGIYPFAISAHSFFITNNDGLSLLFEAVDELQMIRITTALRGIIARLAKKIVTGESDWVGQMMLVSTAQVVKFDDLEGMVSSAMSDVSDCLVMKTAFAVSSESDKMSRKTAWMKQARERRARLLHRRTSTV